MKESHVTLDHVIPLSRGGADEIDNTVACHYTCNMEKGNKLPDEFACTTGEGNAG